jgi:hypothetical protein
MRGVMRGDFTIRQRIDRAICKTIGHPPLAKWQPKMYGRICPRCRTYRVAGEKVEP